MRYITYCERLFRIVLVALLIGLMTFTSPLLSQTALARRSFCHCRRSCPQVHVVTQCCQPVIANPVPGSSAVNDNAVDTDSTIVNTESNSVNNIPEKTTVQQKTVKPNTQESTQESTQVSKAIHETLGEEENVNSKDEQRSIVKEQESYPVAEQLPPMEVIAPESTDTSTPLSSKSDGAEQDSSSAEPEIVTEPEVKPIH